MATKTVASLLLLAVLEVAIFASRGDALKALACEGGHLSLACPADTFINISMAMFGRDDNNLTCPHATAMAHTSCASPTAYPAAMALCQGRRYCDIDAISYYFGDSCNGTYKYLRLEYACSPCMNKHGDDAKCEQWALEGACTGKNADWMEANCSKACYKCEAFIEPVCKNVELDANCTQFARDGECQKNPSWMGAYCKKACAECEQQSACENKANSTLCDNWQSWGECVNNTNWMLPNCSKSCFGCSSDNIKCENKNANCDWWALQGYCQTNPGYMITQCTRSCLGCTRDPVCMNKYSDCEQWARQGECAANSVWMHKNCWKSCLQCSSPTTCANLVGDEKCERWAADGECANNYDFMSANCRLSCTRCKALEYGPAKCFNAHGNDTACEEWADKGECTNNPKFMLKRCYKTCTFCSRPYSIGNYAAPGEVRADTASNTVITPYAFSNTSVITQFTGFFATVNPVHLQVWKPNGTTSFKLVYDELVIPSAANQAQSFLMKWCIVVEAGDRLGFTSLSGPAPIAHLETDSKYYEMALRPAVQSGNFVITNVPFTYSFSAEFYFGSTC
jgi:hypothetical protein